MVKFIKDYFATAGSRLELTQATRSARTAGQNTLAGKTGKTDDQGQIQPGNGTRNGQDYFDRVMRLMPYETTVIFAMFSANLIKGDDDTFGHVATFLACTIVTAVLRFPLLTMEKGRRQPGTYCLNLAICWTWLYAVGSYLVDFGPRDDQVAWGIMVILGAILPMFPIWKERPGLMDK